MGGAVKFTVYNEIGLQQLIGAMRKMFAESRYLKGSYSDEKPRSLPQNRLSHDWYQQISTELGEDTPSQVKCQCKLLYGVPIMRRDDPEFCEVYDRCIKRTMTYEQKLEIMRFFPVTSLMNTTQLSEYLTEMKEGYRGRVQLEWPEERAAA